MFKKTPAPSATPGRPTTQTPYGALFTDTEAFANYVEQRRLHEWHASFLSDMESLRIDAATAVKRIDDFWATLKPEHGGLKTGQLARIRASLAGNTEIHLGPQLTALRRATDEHMKYGPGNAAQVCERPPAADSLPYNGPFPRKSGDHTPAYGYQRAMADGRL